MLLKTQFSHFANALQIVSGKARFMEKITHSRSNLEKCLATPTTPVHLFPLNSQEGGDDREKRRNRQEKKVFFILLYIKDLFGNLF
jgi:hypothetical protein